MIEVDPRNTQRKDGDMFVIFYFLSFVYKF